jgi:hemimethylated DNA binding protein
MITCVTLNQFKNQHQSSRILFSTNATTTEKQKKVSRTLYRQLLRWTKRTGYEVPLDPMPPLNLVPPIVHESALKSVSSYYNNVEAPTNLTKHEKHLYNLTKTLPSNSIVNENNMIIPLQNVTEIKNAIQMIFNMNHADEDPVYTKQRISLAFEFLKSLNELSGVLDERKKKHLENIDRTGVIFHIGQVVRHKTAGWRAVVYGWKRIPKAKNDISKKTSLTCKDYSMDDNTNETLHHVQYQVQLDEGDAVFARLRVLGSMHVSQNELEPVTDTDLKRVRNSLMKKEIFNSLTGDFELSKALQYEYPNDVSDEKTNVGDSKLILSKHENAKRVIKGIHDVASQLQRIILDTTSCAASRKIAILSYIEEKLQAIIEDKLDNVADILSSEHSSHKKAIQHLHAIINISLEINSLVWQRRIHELHKDNLLFHLGSVVKHKLYGFRGVVVEVDPYPKTDVSHWDGLKDIEGDVNNMPFYHVIADLDDTVAAFGSERSFRYVCQANLELCPESESKTLNINLDRGWVYNNGKYIAPDFNKFCHLEPIEAEDDVVSCVDSLQKKCSELFVQIRDRKDSAEEKNVCSLALTSGDLFDLLNHTNCLEDAFIVDEAIKELGKAHCTQNVRWKLDDGIAQLLRGDKLKALDLFEEVLDEDQLYSEAWNKKSTCHYLLGEFPASIDSAITSCETNPTNYQAYAGLGLVYYDMNLFQKAAKNFRKCLALNPWSLVGSRLNICLRTLNKMILDEDKETPSSK